ncbi:Transmembrane emp24 domain-containing protein 1, partial [Stegodyphus mimosarum]
MITYLIYIYFSLPLLISVISGQKYPYDVAESELTITINPGAVECFFQKAKAGSSVEVEYQVIDANFGDVEIHQELDINFQLFSPHGRELISDYKQSDATHRYDVKEDGDFKFCFDNRHSHFSKKTVYFELFVDSNPEDYTDWWKDYDFSPELLYNDTVGQIKKPLELGTQLKRTHMKMMALLG